MAAQMQDSNEFALQHCFGPDQWKTHFGNVGGCPPLPSNASDILQSPCPVWKGKKTWETHKLFLVPQRLEAQPVSLNLIGDMIRNPKQGHRAEYLYFSSYVKADIGTKYVDAAHWCLLTKDIIPGSTSMDYKDQCRFMEALRERLDLPYAIPSTFEAALCILLHYVETGERIFARNDARQTWTFTRCSDEVSAEHWAVAVGGFEPKGLLIYRSPDFLFDRHFAGTAGVRRF